MNEEWLEKQISSIIRKNAEKSGLYATDSVMGKRQGEILTIRTGDGENFDIIVGKLIKLFNSKK